MLGKPHTTISRDILTRRILDDNYHKILVELRERIDFENSEFRNMDKVIDDEINQGHSFYMIVENHSEFNITKRALYYYQEKGHLSCKNIDLPIKKLGFDFINSKDIILNPNLFKDIYYY